jgi:hypothetical protein
LWLYHLEPGSLRCSKIRQSVASTVTMRVASLSPTAALSLKFQTI